MKAECEKCNNFKEIEVYIGIEETLLLCDDCIYIEEIKISPNRK